MNKLLNYLKATVPVIFRDVWINGFIASGFIPHSLRKFLYNLTGMKIEKAVIRGKVFFEGNETKRVHIKKGTFVNYGCFFSCSAPIEIGENCDIAFRVTFCTSTHELGTSERRAGKAIGEPIKVGNGVWIGANATIMPGVTIEDGCIIAAGSVVTKDCKKNGLYAGVPAQRIKELETKVNEPVA